MQHIAISLALLVSAVAVPTMAQVKDVHGEPLAAGQPAEGEVRDFNGGTITAGREASCSIGEADAERQSCIFFPRNKDGSFAIDVSGKAYYADKVDQTRVVLFYDNGARLVPLGQYVRSKDQSDCWVQAEHSVCVTLSHQH
ncbi:hypothetical protein [Asticcacaulis tiandongensis]|uniref:hypothetical protein n=1 Tax=Asticcacaulis tiandongensis TaxID=2565365 RepID=UPI00112CE237|nr:hypothetical protein [Asticcacaulis tiandongensis]